MPEKSRPILHLKFAPAAAPKVEPETGPPRLARPPRDRPADAKTMRAYVDNLEARMVHHVQRHTRLWVDRETGKILNRWNAPILRPSAPRGAPPRDVRREARQFAEELVLDRVQTRFRHFHALRHARGLVHDPLGDRHRVLQVPGISGLRNNRGRKHK